MSGDRGLVFGALRNFPSDRVFVIGSKSIRCNPFVLFILRRCSTNLVRRPSAEKPKLDVALFKYRTFQ
jgi:hypothetical protein